jgi:hypothetical protein
VRRILIAAAALVVAVVGTAAPAAADPATPTNFESRVLSVTPARAASAISVKVVGGDGFLELHVHPGHTAIVRGYGTSGYGTVTTAEPWLQVLRDGTVQENQNSPATYLNANRYATNPKFPPGFDINKASSLPPIWATVGRHGTYVWHDHRIHWMGAHQQAPLVPGTHRVRLTDRSDGNWIVPMVVDGQATTVRGELLLHPAPSPLPWLALLVGAAALVVALGLVLDPIRAATVGVAAAGIVAIYAGFQQRAVVPDAAGGSPLSWLLPAFGIVCAASAVLFRNRPARVIALLAGSATVIGWGLMDFDALWKAMPLSALSAPAAHALQAAAMGLAAGAALSAIRSGALASVPRELAVDEAENVQPPTAPGEANCADEAASGTRPGQWRDPDLGPR